MDGCLCFKNTLDLLIYSHVASNIVNITSCLCIFIPWTLRAVIMNPGHCNVFLFSLPVYCKQTERKRHLPHIKQAYMIISFFFLSVQPAGWVIKKVNKTINWFPHAYIQCEWGKYSPWATVFCQQGAFFAGRIQWSVLLAIAGHYFVQKNPIGRLVVHKSIDCTTS